MIRTWTLAIALLLCPIVVSAQAARADVAGVSAPVARRGGTHGLTHWG